MRLSIGMIVKNEEQYLDRCLAALESLRKNVESELIIVDTGSTDSSVEIAKKYTDKVYHFEWCDDFSAARNETIRYACGDWYMALDADEIFVDTKPIELFLKNPEADFATTASFIVKNYFNTEMTESSNLDVVRLIKNVDDLRYEGVIHEHFRSETLGITDKIPDCTKLNALADHYGYMYISEEENLKKYERNHTLLYSLYEEKKNNPNYFTQLYDLEASVSDFEKAGQYAKRCIELSENYETMRSVGYYLYANALYFQGEFEDILTVAENYFSEVHTFEHICDMPMYMYRGVAYFRTENFENAAKDFEIYFRLRTKYADYTTPEVYLHPINGFENDLYILRILECAITYEQLGDVSGLSNVLRMESPEFFDNNVFFEKGYTRDYVMHAVLLAVQGGDRSVADMIAAEGTDREKTILNEVIQQAVSQQQSPADEFAAYAVRIKDTIRSLIAEGMIDQAKILVEKYKQLCPDDEEIIAIEKLYF